MLLHRVSDWVRPGRLTIRALEVDSQRSGKSAVTSKTRNVKALNSGLMWLEVVERDLAGDQSPDACQSARRGVVWESSALRRGWQRLSIFHSSELQCVVLVVIIAISSSPGATEHQRQRDLHDSPPHGCTTDCTTLLFSLCLTLPSVSRHPASRSSTSTDFASEGIASRP